MAFVKGQPKKGGKVKGTPNKVTATIRDKFQQLLDGYTIEAMVKDLKAIDNPKDRMMIISNLSEFIVPKLSRSEVKTESDEMIVRIVREDGSNNKPT